MSSQCRRHFIVSLFSDSSTRGHIASLPVLPTISSAGTPPISSNRSEMKVKRRSGPISHSQSELAAAKSLNRCSLSRAAALASRSRNIRKMTQQAKIATPPRTIMMAVRRVSSFPACSDRRSMAIILERAY